MCDLLLLKEENPLVGTERVGEVITTIVSTKEREEKHQNLETKWVESVWLRKVIMMGIDRHQANARRAGCKLIIRHLVILLSYYLDIN
jgi:hypothetical protein